MNIIVTGASRGIGYETVMHLSGDANHTIIAIARNLPGLLKLEKEVEDSGGLATIHIFSFNLENGNFEDILLPFISRKMIKVDILINNAGLLISKPFDQMDKHDFDRIFNANVKSIFSLTKFLLPYFSQAAHIVNIGSMGGVQGSMKFPGLSLYSASKGAVAVLTECLAVELKERGISVNCLALGAAQTEMLTEAFPAFKAPLSAAEMAEFIADFSLNGHKWFNGKILPVAVSTP